MNKLNLEAWHAYAQLAVADDVLNPEEDRTLGGQLIEGPHGLRLHGRKDVRIGIQGDAHAGVPQALGDYLGVHPLQEQIPKPASSRRPLGGLQLVLAGVLESQAAAGWMFWFRWNRLSGS